MGLKEKVQKILEKKNRTGELAATKWAVLLEFCAVSAWQGATWFTFGSVPESAARWLGVHDATVALLTNWGPIAFLVSALPIMWTTSRRHGLRPAVVFGAALVVLCSLSRLIPALFPSFLLPDPSDPSDHTLSSSSDGNARRTVGQTIGILLVHGAQIANALAGPVVMAPVALLSSAWFPESQRTIATSIAWVANGLGICIAFLLGPALAPTATAMPRLLGTELAISFVPLVLVLFHFPSPPPHPPSTARNGIQQASPLLSETPGQGTKEVGFIEGLLMCIRSRDAVASIVVGGLGLGMASGVSGCLPQLLLSSGIAKTQAVAGWIGFGGSILGLVGSLLIGRVADMLLGRHRRRHRVLLIATWWASAVGFAVLLIAFPLPWNHNGEAPPVSGVAGVAVAALGLGFSGLFQGATTPLVYEILARHCAASSATTAGLVALLSNAVATVLLFVSPHVFPAVVCWSAAIAYIACSIVSTLFVGRSAPLLTSDFSDNQPTAQSNPTLD